MGDDLSPGRGRVCLVDEDDQQAEAAAKLVHAKPGGRISQASRGWGLGLRVYYLPRGELLISAPDK